MTKKTFTIFIIVFILAGGTIASCESVPGDKDMDSIKLPEPQYDSGFSVERALRQRRSIRDYLNEPLTLKDVSQLLWAAQGITEPAGLRTAPSAGALYPLEAYLVAGRVSDLPAGVYKYRPQKHELIKVVKGDVRSQLASAALGQEWVRDGAVVIVFAAVYERTTIKYGQRGIRYVHIETGHVAQNVYLQAGSFNLGTVIVGAFYDDEVKRILKMPAKEYPLCIMPVGKVNK